MTHRFLSTFQAGDVTVQYGTSEDGARVGLALLPTALLDKVVARRQTLQGRPEIDPLPWPAASAMEIDSLIHLKILGDPCTSGFGQGRTMRNAPSTEALRFEKQDVERQGRRTTVITTLLSPSGLRCEHRLSWQEGEESLEAVTSVTNAGTRPVTLEMLTSFSLGDITPFDAADAPGRLRVHRFRAAWSAEGRLDTQSVEQLHLERSWIGVGYFSERFGQVGTMPARGWFPFVAAEDTQAGVLWGVQLAWAGSWQMEIFRKDDQLCLSGGLADRELGHWTKTLAPGETLQAPPATLACVHGDLDALCHRLTAAQQAAADTHPAVEADLPIIFNEWCTTWGDPAHEKLMAIANRLKDSETRFLVIDAGWYKSDHGNWGAEQGDWIPSRTLFPEGLAATAAAIRRRGLIPGLWFEMEVCGHKSAAFSLVDHMLKRDGIPITVGSRRFWNLDDPFALDHLTRNVIGLLRDGGFGYLKVDYNETIGLGCDGAESLGEGLRRHTLAIYRFFDRIRRELPELVIENCSSGGHRLEPSMMARAAMGSFSDAHELREIPIIAANLHRLILPRQSQIWAVLRQTDDPRRLVYSLAATFLGRMCLSGTIMELSDAQWATVQRAQRLYRKVWPILKHGRSYRYGDLGASYRYPQGWQGVLRVGRDGREALAVIHQFAKPLPGKIELPLPREGPWVIQDVFDASREHPTIAQDRLLCPLESEFEACVVHLARR